MSVHHEKSDCVEKELFNKNEPTQALLSNEIRVKDRPVVITHWNPVDGEFLCLVKFNLTGCGPSLAGDIVFVKDCNCQYICVCCECNTITVKQPGRYKLMKRGVINNAQVTYRYISSRYLGCS